MTRITWENGLRVEHPTGLRVIQRDCQRIPVGLPVVDDHRQVQLLRQGHLVPEDLLLKRPGRVLLPVVVQGSAATPGWSVTPARSWRK